MHAAQSNLAGLGPSARIIRVTSGVVYEDQHLLEEPEMIASGKQAVALYVDRSCPQHWIVRDPEGNFWIVPPVENPWENREPFILPEEADLEPIPGHYRYMLGLPF